MQAPRTDHSKAGAGRKRNDATPRLLYEKLEQQKFLCAITGRALTPETAVLDHIVPISRGGDLTALSNLQFLHADVNRAKGALTTEEFVELCREVINHRERSEP